VIWKMVVPMGSQAAFYVIHFTRHPAQAGMTVVAAATTNFFTPSYCAAPAGHRR
jgi:hypothetical protein